MLTGFTGFVSVGDYQARSPFNFKPSEWRGFPHGSVLKNPPANARNVDSIPESGRFPGVGNAPKPVFLPGEFHGQRSLAGYSSWGCKESDTTEGLSRRAVSGKVKCQRNRKLGTSV